MKKALRIFGLIAVVGILIAAITTSMSKGSNAEKVWDKEMTMGNLDASNYYIIYSDLACPYCVAFENAIIENHEKFEKYIEANDILVEIRLSDFLYEYGESASPESLYGAEAVYCARDEGKFWDYYDAAITKVWNEYFGVSGKSAYSEFSKLGKDYWIEIGKSVGLGDDFENCVMNGDDLEEIQKNAEKSSKLIRGMPYFKFNKYTSSGFDLSWGWEYVLMYLNAGLENK